jgi:hypothetical protein
MSEMVINFNTDGSVYGLHFDEFDLGFLGKKSIKRASDLVFNEDTQLWDIHLPEAFGPVCDGVSGFPSYKAARDFEVEWLQQCMLEKCAPDSEKGVEVAQSLRDGR